jgi:formylmethanofuran dehydrogenase subunit C
MTGLTLKLREPPPQRCDMSALTPDRIAELNGPIEQVEIHTTKERLHLGDIFDVAPGDPSDIHLEGGSDRLDNVGLGMSGGRIVVAGDVGQRVGRAMRGGTIVVEGNAGPLAGSGMSGGRLEIAGDAANFVGGPLAGEPSGMRGGLIRVKGNIGVRGADRMRRGLIVVEGNAGDHLAARIIGGTVVCFGRAGALPGYLMRRGTVIMAGGAASVAPTFIDTGVHELVAMRLIARWLIDEGIEGGSLLAFRLRRLVGDTSVLGKGEVFLPET